MHPSLDQTLTPKTVYLGLRPIEAVLRRLVMFGDQPKDVFLVYFPPPTDCNFGDGGLIGADRCVELLSAPAKAVVVLMSVVICVLGMSVWLGSRKSSSQALPCSAA